ncbi:hypothetical protein OUZ56_022237 [Daphnia magna]|uniref:Hsp70-interacting protein N-terminal domain-containing protein n=1 Tax=Daphnia magna TaxID=35525 RepID=A0ABR0AVS0_9CRUS|nr:hypothetical protein OUZ56_022237 [Daphnia magna]
MPSIKIPEKQLTELRAFVTLLKSQPSLLQQPELQFLKEYIESLGGKVPACEIPKTEIPKSCPAHESHKASVPAEDEEPELVESDVELDQTGVIEPDNEPPQEMGNPEQEMSEADEEKFSDLRQQATAAFAEGEYNKAADCFTEVIKLNPQSALMFAKRANCYIHLNKPNACIRDCDRAIEINPDCAPAHKFRGRAHRLLGNWEEAVKDLRLACKIDYDDQANDWLKEVTPNTLCIRGFFCTYHPQWRRGNHLQVMGFVHCSATSHFDVGTDLSVSQRYDPA